MEDTFQHGYALLIGVDDNAVAKYKLPPVKQDIIALAHVLTRADRCGYPSTQVKTITGEAATKQGILAGLDWLTEQLDADANATAVIHYSGHGWRDNTTNPPDYFLVPYDMSATRFRSKLLRVAEVSDRIADLDPARLLVVLDCCHAGGMDIRDLTPAPDGYTSAAVPPERAAFRRRQASTEQTGATPLTDGHGRATLSASQGDQPSYNRKDGKMGIFTYHLIEALTGHSKLEDGAKAVRVSNLISYVEHHVPRSSQHDWQQTQKPMSRLDGDFPIALVLGGRGVDAANPSPDPVEDAESIPQYQAAVHGSGAIAQGEGAVAASGGSVAVGGNVGGDIRIGNDTNVNTGGGAYIGGGVNTGGGDFVGRDKVTTYSGASAADIERLFASIFAEIEAHPSLTNADKADLQADVAEVQAEATKAEGESVDESFLMRRLRSIRRMAPDIAEVVFDTLLSPAAGVKTAIVKIAQQIKGEERTPSN